jgi:hypothetical protein
MASATFDMEQSSPRRGWLPQLAITLFLGIPLTLALTIGLVFYCLYECAKFAFSRPSSSHDTAHSEDHTFTNSLTKLARIHAPTQPVETAANPAPAAPGQNQSAETSDSRR